jgi:hypothetical protein
MLTFVKTSPNSEFVHNPDVANCEAIVFAEAVRTGRTMLQVVKQTLDDIDGDDNLDLFCACETLETEWQTYTR